MVCSVFSMVFLSAAGCQNEPFPHPFSLGFARGFDGLFDLRVFNWREARGNELAALLLVRECWPANRIWCAHGFLPFFGGGVFNKAVKVSLNETLLRFGNITSLGFALRFVRFVFATVSLSTPRDAQGFWFHKTVTMLSLIPSNNLPVCQAFSSG
jgi:hypothetical protein